ncbi:class I SAM-dependent methyltransferase [Halalkalibacter oceani]|uniref:class I SAM-dependent methyltransferase n=1 Tax=Halalkalibacter oceani TaxID=1653776 RepID=UPI00339B04A2
MNVPGILPFARLLLEKALEEGDTALDCTVGNGHDTVFLAGLVGEEGQVLGFDIQAAAIENTRARLREARLEDRVTLFQQSHEHAADQLAGANAQRLKAAIFNLGYLPGGDKAIVTRPESTISAVQSLLELMQPGGIIVLVIYHGHREGQHEKKELLSYAESIDQRYAHVLTYQFINQANHPPFVLALEKR